MKITNDLVPHYAKKDFDKVAALIFCWSFIRKHLIPQSLFQLGILSKKRWD